MESFESQDRRIRIGDTYLGVIYIVVIAKERMARVRKQNEKRRKPRKGG